MPFFYFLSLSPSWLKFWPIMSDRNAIKFVTKPTTSVTYASSNEDLQNFYNYIMRAFISWYRTIHPIRGLSHHRFYVHVHDPTTRVVPRRPHSQWMRSVLFHLRTEWDPVFCFAALLHCKFKFFKVNL